MSRTPEALVRPELIAWARRSIGFEPGEVAKKVGVPLERILEWECGESRPSVAQLRKLSEVCKRPMAVFFLPTPPKTFDAMRDFRRLPDEGELPSCPELKVEIFRSLQRREIAVELLEDLGELPPPFPIQLPAAISIDEAARAIRRNLGISLQEQFGLGKSDTAFKAWLDRVEHLGVLVFQTEKVPVEVMRGVSVSRPTLPIIIINGQEFPNGKLFTLMHEIAHISMNNGGICDQHDLPSRHPDTDTIEIKCNAIAAAVLMPTDAISKEQLVLDHVGVDDWSDSDLQALARKYGVSTEAMLRRLLTIGKTSEAFYRAKRDEFQEAYRQYLKTKKAKQKESKSGPPRFRMVLRSNGYPYSRIVVDAYREERITLSDLADYIGAKVTHLPAIESALSVGTRGGEA